MTGYFLGLLPTPGGDKYHLFHLENETIEITNDMGTTLAKDIHSIDGGVGFTMETGPVDHIFDLNDDTLNLDAKVARADTGEVMASFQIKLTPTGRAILPENPA